MITLLLFSHLAPNAADARGHCHTATTTNAAARCDQGDRQQGEGDRETAGEREGRGVRERVYYKY